MNNKFDSDIVQVYSGGTVRKFVTLEGQEFEAFVPNNCSSSTSVIMYEHGDGGYHNDWRSYVDKFSTGNCDSIVIRANRNNSISLYNHVVNQYGIENNTNINVNVSFSGGTAYSLRETAQMINENPQMIPPISVILDGYVDVSDTDVINTLIESDALVLSFGKSYVDYLTESSKQLARTGANVVIFTDKSNYANSHQGINNSYMDGGLYEYILGRSKLPNRYDIKVYDSNIGDFITLDYFDVSDIGKVYEYFGLENSTNISFSVSDDNNFIFNNSNSLSNSFLSLFDEKPMNLKYSNYKGYELSVKPNTVDYVVGYLSKVVVDDLASQMDAVRAVHAANTAYAAEDPAVSYSLDLSDVEGSFSNASSSCIGAASSINAVANAIMKYGNGEWNEGISNILNSFLGIRISQVPAFFSDDFNNNSDTKLENFSSLVSSDNNVLSKENIVFVEEQVDFFADDNSSKNFDRFNYLDFFNNSDNEVISDELTVDNTNILENSNITETSIFNESFSAPKNSISVGASDISNTKATSLAIGSLALGAIGYKIVNDKNKEKDELQE